MTDHISFDALCDLVDHTMEPHVDAAARWHVERCAECASLLSDISSLRATAAALPRDVAPPVGLWNDILADIALPTSPVAKGTGIWNPRWLAAAGIIAIASSGLTALVLRNNTHSVPVASNTALPVPPAVEILPARLASEEQHFTESVDVLQRTLSERRRSLAPSTIATVEHSLRIADSAIAEARTALARDPANKDLAKLFASNYERKIDLLRRASELAPRT